MIESILKTASKFGIKTLSLKIRLQFHNFILFGKRKNKKKEGAENELRKKSR